MNLLKFALQPLVDKAVNAAKPRLIEVVRTIAISTPDVATMEAKLEKAINDWRVKI